jgi:Ca2+-binding RTX toxin-like protein
MTLIGGQQFTSLLLQQLQQAANPQGAQGPQNLTIAPQAQLVPGANGTFTLQAGAGNDAIRIARAANGLYGVNVNKQDFFFTKEQLAKLTIHAGDGDNQIAIDPNVDVPVMVKSGAGRDRIMNGANGAMIDTGAGQDQIYNRAVAAKIHGGEGTDLIDSFGHTNELNGGLGDDFVRARGNRNLIQGGDGNDSLQAGGNQNFVRGGGGNDQLYAGGIQNRVDGGLGNNNMFAGGIGNIVEASACGWNNIGVLGLGNIANGQLQGADPRTFSQDLWNATRFLGLGPDAWSLDPRGVPQGFDPFNPQGQAPQAGGLLAPAPQGVQGGQGGMQAAPTMFDALNVHQDLRQWTADCGARGCCKWEPAIA